MIRCLLVGLVCWIIVELPQARADETILTLTNATLPPVTTPSGDGFLDRIATEMFERAGMKLELSTPPAARALALSNTGLLDGDLARIQINSEFFPNLLRLPDPLIGVLFAGLYSRSGINVKTLDDFSHFRVGYIRGWVIAEKMFAGDTNATATGSVDQLLDMLEADRIDIAFMTVAPGRYLADTRGMGKLGVTGYGVKKDLYLYLHEKHAIKIQSLSTALASMKEDGTHDAILREYRLAYQ